MAQGPLQKPCEGGIRLSMLPGFRFLFAAIVLSMSILVFGLGAAALLRAAHEEFASTPTWHATPETIFAQQNEAARPVLALLRVDAPVEQKVSDNDTAPAAQPTAPAVIASVPAEPETSAASTPENSSLPEAVKPEIPVTETSPQVEAAPVQAAPASADETRIAAVAASTDEAAPAAPEQVSVPNSPEADAASMKIATLGGPPVIIGPPAVSANPDKSAVKKRRQAQRAKARRRIAQRARMTAQTVLQPADPFAQPVAAVRSR
jgi:cytoskeletal protein RodZ